MISIIVPTIGRPSLAVALASLTSELLPGDEVLVIGNVDEREEGPVRYIRRAPGGDWGHSERNFAMKLCCGRYIAHLDDDDTFAPGWRALVQDAIDTSEGRPIIFRMRYPSGQTLWIQPQLCLGNVGTPMMLTPNEPEKFGVWGSFHGGDFHFLETSRWRRSDYVWRPEVLAELGHN